MALQFDLNSKQAARILDKSAKTVLRWAKEGRLTYMTVQTPQRDYYRFNQVEVDRLLTELQREKNLAAARQREQQPSAMVAATTATIAAAMPVVSPSSQTVTAAVSTLSTSQAATNAPSQPHTFYNQLAQTQQALLSKLEGASHRLERVEKLLAERPVRPQQMWSKPMEPQPAGSQQTGLPPAGSRQSEITHWRTTNLALRQQLTADRTFFWTIAVLVFVLGLELLIYWWG